MSAKKVRDLEELDPKINAEETTFDVIIVPDSELQKKKRDQITPLCNLISTATKEETRKARVFKYTPDWRKNDKNIWQTIVDAGDSLVDTLARTHNDPKQIRPLLFISYGFGGLVTKRALRCIAELKENIYPLYRTPKELVFVGVPHPTRDHKCNWQKLNTHLIVYGAFKTYDLNEYNSHRESAVDASHDFKEFVRQENIVENIFTIYEAHETEYSDNCLTRKRKTLVVGKLFSSTGAPGEIICESDTNYFDMALFNTSLPAVYEKLVKVVKTCSKKLRLQAYTDDREFRFTTYEQDAQSSQPILPLASPGAQCERLPATPTTRSHSSELATPTDSSRPSASFDMVFYGHRTPQTPCYYRKQIDRNIGFVDRPDIIAQIDSSLLADTDMDGIRSFALCGYGGIGKTQLAMHYAFAREAEFDAIFWVPADEPVKLAKSFEEIAKALNLVTDTRNIDPVACRNLVLEWLCEPCKEGAGIGDVNGFGSRRKKTGMANWLLIFDNVDNLECVRDYWAKSSHGPHRSCILVTSRDDLAKSQLAVDGLDLEPMTAEQCVTLLLKQAKPAASVISEQTRQAAAKLAERVGCLPLAITTIAARICENHMSIEEFWHRYDHKGMLNQLSKVKQLPPREQYPYTIRTVWRFEEFPPSARGLLNVMVFLDNGAVPDFVLEQDIQSELSEIDKVLAEVVTTDQSHECLLYYPQPDQYIDIRNRIMQTSLVHCNETSGSLSWHKLVQDVAAEQMTSEEKAAYFALAIHLLQQAWTFNQDRFTAENVKDSKRDELLPHIIRISKIYSKVLIHNGSLLQKTSRKLANLLQSAGLYLVQTFQFTSAKTLFELAMKICEDQGDTLKDLLADTSFSYARFGAVTNMHPETIFQYCQKFHDICYDLNDNSDDAQGDLATSHTNMGQGYLLLDRPREAVEHCQKCIEIEEHLPDHVNDGAISQFALIYQAWGYIGMGEYELAAKQAQVVIDYRALRYPNDKDADKLGLALQCLGRARELQGRIDECVEAYSRAEVNYRDFGGNDNFRFAQMSLKLGEHYSRQPGHSQFAPNCIDEAIRVFRMHHFYEPELARALFKKHQYEVSRRPMVEGQSEDNETSPWLEAQQLYRKLRRNSGILERDPGSDDFDQLVRFWSR